MSDPTRRAPRILVAGVGNVLRGDDGFGFVAARKLMARNDMPEGVWVIETGIGGMSLVQEPMAGYDELVLLDACRNNPFATKMQRSAVPRDVNRGLSKVNPKSNVLVAFAAKDGTTATDGLGRNSPFAAALLKNLETPGLEIDLLFRRVRDAVIASTNGLQQPFVYGSLSKHAIYLKRPLSAADLVDECDRLAASPFATSMTRLHRTSLPIA